MVDLPGFNDAAYNWETFESNTFFSLFTTDSLETKYGFDLRLTCQKPLPKKNKTISGEECMMWSDIFEDWPKAEINNGTRTYEFLPSFETFENATHQYEIPVSLYNITYITWEDNRSCDNFIWNSDFGISKSAVVISYVIYDRFWSCEFPVMTLVKYVVEKYVGEDKILFHQHPSPKLKQP